MKKKSYKIALGGVVSSLSLVVMLLASVIPGLEYTIPALAGILLIVIVIEINLRWALLSYVAVALLTFFIVPNKESGLLYITFMGYYPIIKSVFETKIKPRAGQWAAKFALFNAALVVYYQLVKLLVVSQELTESLGKYGKYSLVIMLGLANVVFLVYDVALTNIITAYMKWFRKKFIKHIDK